MRIVNQLRIATQLILLVILVTTVATFAVGELFVRDTRALLQRRSVAMLRERAQLRELALQQDMRLFGQFVREAVAEFVVPFKRSGDKLPEREDIATALKTAGKALRAPTALNALQRQQRRDLDPPAFVEICYLRRLPDGSIQPELSERVPGTLSEGTASAPLREAVAEITRTPGQTQYYSPLHIDTEGATRRCLVANVYPVWPKEGVPEIYLGVTLDFSRMFHNSDRRDTRDLLLLVDQAGIILAHPNAAVLGESLGVEWNFPEVTWQPLDEGRVDDSALTDGVGINSDQPVADQRLYFSLARTRVSTDLLTRHGKQLAEQLDHFTDHDPTLQVRAPTIGNPTLEITAPRLTDVNAALDRLNRAGGPAGEVPASGWRRVECKQMFARLVPLRLTLQDQKQALRLIVCVALEEITEAIAYETAWARFGWPLVILIAAALLALFAARLIARPLQRLTEASEVLAQGDYTVDFEASGNGEVAQLARVLNRTVGEIRKRDASLREANETLEERVRQRTAELEEARVELEHALHAARAADQAKENFLRTMSHELRQPLNIVIGFTEAIREEAEDSGNDAILPDLNKIHAAGRHLLALINDILDLTKIRAGKMDLRPTEFSLDTLLEEVSVLIDPLVKKNHNTYALQAPRPAGQMFGDEVRLKQILINLLSNASKFTSDGTVTLTVEREPGPGGNWVAFTVHDTGKGMSAAQLEKLFEPFYQVDSSVRREQGGTGLGLTITLALTELMGGKVTVTSVEGTGSTFRVRVPERLGQRSAPPSDWSMGLRSPEADTGFPGVRGETVLVIDDDPGVRELMERFLTREGFIVKTAPNGEEGLRLAKEWRPSVITLDVMMPGVDGWATLAALKTDPTTQDIPVVMLTIVDDRRRGFKLGASEYLTKPIDWQRLGGILQKYVARGCTAPVLIVDDDPDNRTLMRNYLCRAGWNVEEAENGQVALERFRANIPSLILLDLMMPVMDGFQFLEELSRSGLRNGVPVIVLTAKDLTDDDRLRLNGEVERILLKGDVTQVQDLDGLLQQLVRAVRPPAGESLRKENGDAPSTAGG